MAKKSTKKQGKKTSAKKTSAKKASPKKAAAKKSVAKRKTSKPAQAAKPAGPKGTTLTSIAPGFTSNDAAASIQWYCDVLGFKVIERWEHNGEFRGAQIGSGDVVINIGQDDWKMGRDRIKGQGTRMYVQMGPEIDKFAAEIKARGGQLDQEPADGWGVRTFSLTDPDGFKLTFMTIPR